MGQEDLFKVLSDISMADSTSYWIVGSLTLLVFVVMRAMLPVKSLAIVFAPVIFWGGLCGIYGMRELGFVASSERSANIVATATIGMVVALVIVMLIVRFIEAATRIRKAPVATPVPVPRPRRVGI
jgi:hypothetical protein